VWFGSRRALASTIPKQGAVGFAAKSLGASILALEMAEVGDRWLFSRYRRRAGNREFTIPYTDGKAPSDFGCQAKSSLLWFVDVSLRPDPYAENYFAFWYVPINSAVPTTWP
jgi:hypothetical protein